MRSAEYPALNEYGQSALQQSANPTQTASLYLESLCPSAELGNQLNFWCSATSYEEPLVHKASHNTEGVMQTAFSFLQHQLVAASEKASCCAPFVVNAHYLDHFAFAHLQQHA